MPDDINPVPPGSLAPGEPPRLPEAAPRPTEIVLNPRPLARPVPAGPKKSPTPPEDRDGFREVVETVVFVVVLVLLLKTFLAEAFVIPTGSMATTLLGYHRVVVCEKCGFSFLVNASKEADPQDGAPQPVVSCTCPNCEFTNQVQHPHPHPQPQPFDGGPR